MPRIIGGNFCGQSDSCQAPPINTWQFANRRDLAPAVIGRLSRSLAISQSELLAFCAKATRLCPASQAICVPRMTTTARTMAAVKEHDSGEADPQEEREAQQSATNPQSGVRRLRENTLPRAASAGT